MCVQTATPVKVASMASPSTITSKNVLVSAKTPLTTSTQEFQAITVFLVPLTITAQDAVSTSINSFPFVSSVPKETSSLLIKDAPPAANLLASNCL